MPTPSSTTSRGWSSCLARMASGCGCARRRTSSAGLPTEGPLRLHRAMGLLDGRLAVEVRLALAPLLGLQSLSELAFGLVLRRRTGRHLLLRGHFVVSLGMMLGSAVGRPGARWPLVGGSRGR